MRILDISRTRLTIFVVLLCVLVGTGVAQVWIWSLVQARVAAWYEGRSRDEQLSAVQERVRLVEQSLAANTALLDQLPAVAPSTAQIPILIDRVERMADERGLSVRVTAIEEGAGVLVPLTVRLEISGGSEALFSYLHALEHRQELAQVTVLTLMPVGRQVAGIYTMTLTVTFYLQPPVEDARHGQS